MSRPPPAVCSGVLFLLAACASGPAPGPALPGTPPSDTAISGTIAPGATWTRTRDARGPWAIHVLQIDLEACRPEFRAAKAGPRLSGRATTSALGADALAAVNADFFELPGGQPVGAHVSNGDVLIGPGERPVLAMTAAGPVQGTARIEGWLAMGPDTVRIRQVNRRSAVPGPQTGVLLITSGSALEPAATAVRVRTLEGRMRHGRGVVHGAGTAGTVGIGPGELLIEGLPEETSGLADGDTVEWDVRLAVDGSAAAVLEAVGGFPSLLRGGRIVVEGNPDIRPDFGDRRHPRTAVGWNARHVFLVVVDGRQPAWSDGMSLPELALLFRGLGAREAINLDGGGSSAMVVGGKTINRPSDATGERPVGNALLLERCSDPGEVNPLREPDRPRVHPPTANRMQETR